MGKTILFSPIGNTDPIKYQHDGSMLHICRKYQPDTVYLYLSKEILRHHEADNRYVKSLELLGEKLGHLFEIKLIKNDKMVDVQDYDTFFKEFNDILAKIEKEMTPEDTLLVNMASGTPAMKSALVVMATLAEYRFIPIQVATPKKESNLEYEDRVDYDILLNWEYNLDNEEEYEDRCKEVKCGNLIQMLKMDMIKKHVLAYDYHAAYEVFKDLKESLSEEMASLLELAAERLKLNLIRVNQLDKKYQFDVIPVKSSDKQKLFEYALALQIKLKRGEYADFVRGITPISDDLLEIVLESECKIRLEDYCVQKKSGSCWSAQKMKNTQVDEILNKEFGNFQYGMTSSIHFAKLIENLSTDDILKRKIKQLVDAEQMVRNVAAHEVVSVTEEWIKERTNVTPQELMDIIRYLCVKAKIGAKKEDWSAYDHMNQKIIKGIGL